MKRNIILLFGLLFSTTTLATPTLQLDIAGGTYIGGTEQSVITSQTNFDVYAYGNAGSSKFDLNTTYYISMALSPQVNSITGFESTTFDFAGTRYTLGNMTYGTPPLDAQYKNIAGHSVYDTYYFEFGFMFDAINTASLINVQDPGVAGVGPNTNGTGMYYESFNVNMANLAALGFDVHFDLYTLGTSGKTLVFAPYSHDAGTAVPEADTIALFAIGLFGLGFLRFRKV